MTPYTIVKLKELEPNPMRDFAIDPVDPIAVEALRDSIHETGFWGGSTIRAVQRDGVTVYQVGGGWTRVQAAIAEGEEEGQFRELVGDDTQMLRVYVKENATQRGVVALSQAGGVAGALRQCLREQFFAREITSKRGTVRDGIGEDTILAKLAGIKGIGPNIVKQQLSNLKESGHYDRIVREETERFEAEQAAEVERLAKEQAEAIEADERQRLAAEQAEAEANLAKAQNAKVKAKEKARPVTFDLAGVGAHLTKADHLETFRKEVTNERIAKFLDVDQQAPLAKALVELAAASREDQQDKKGRHWRKKGDELTSAFIKQELDDLVAGPEFMQRLADKAERKRAEEELKTSSWTKRWASLEEEIRRFAQRADSSTDKLDALSRERPRGIEIVESNDFTMALVHLRSAVKTLEHFQQPAALEGTVIHTEKESV